MMISQIQRLCRSGAVIYRLSRLFVSVFWFAGCQPEPRVRIFTASSTLFVMEEVAAAFYAETGIKVLVNSASSSTLARQIETGAPADIFLSANMDWMDYLEAIELIDGGSRQNFLGNELVVISSNPKLEFSRKPGDIVGSYGGRISLGDTEHVPVGIYAREALLKSGEWDSVSERLVPTGDASLAVNFVATGEVPLGIVYATDARLAARMIHVLYSVPQQVQPDIVYPIALTLEASNSARAFFKFLQEKESMKLFFEVGFTSLEEVYHD